MITDPTMRLTPPQKRVLAHLANVADGSIPCGPGMGRTHIALVERGLIELDPKIQITDAGRCVLAAQP